MSTPTYRGHGVKLGCWVNLRQHCKTLGTRQAFDDGSHSIFVFRRLIGVFMKSISVASSALLLDVHCQTL